MNISIRSYKSSDYEQLDSLYRQSNLYGGQFDENRDSRERLQKRAEADQDSILVAEQNGKIVGTASLIEDGRIAWLFRFAVLDNEYRDEVAKALLEKAQNILTQRGHHQVLVYSPVGNEKLDKRYEQLGFTKGNDYTAFWKDI